MQYGTTVTDHVSLTENELLVPQSPILPNQGDLTHSQSEHPISTLARTTQYAQLDGDPKELSASTHVAESSWAHRILNDGEQIGCTYDLGAEKHVRVSNCNCPTTRVLEDDPVHIVDTNTTTNDGMVNQNCMKLIQIMIIKPETMLRRKTLILGESISPPMTATARCEFDEAIP